MSHMYTDRNYRLLGQATEGQPRFELRRFLVIATLVTIGIAIAAVVFDLGSYFGIDAVTATPASAPDAGAAAQPAPNLSEIPLVPLEDGQTVTADAIVVPQEFASLSMPAGGVVAAVHVSEGERVEAHQLILTLKNAQAQAAVAQAEAEVKSTVAQLSKLRSGPRAQEIAAAQANVDAVAARLGKLQEGPRSEAISAAEASIAAANAELQQLYSGPSENDRIAAEAELANADAERTRAQSAYNQVAFRNDVGQLPESFQLQDATNTYNAAKARYDALFVEPDAEKVATAQAKVQQAQADLNALVEPATQSEVAEAQAELRRAEADLELLTVGTQDEEVLVAEANLSKAQAELALARANLADTELRAPFAGSLASIDVKVGEQVVVGTPIVQLGNLTSWQIETEGMTELDVVHVQEGDSVRITFDAIEALELGGTILNIKAIGENRDGDITYTAIIQPKEHEPRLRWNMTANVTVE